MRIKDLPHVTVEQVLALRKAAIELEKELAELKASLPKVRADAVREMLEVFEHNCTGWAKDSQGHVYWSDSMIKEYINQLEQGNE